jgi:ankyrin repeat protein
MGFFRNKTNRIFAVAVAFYALIFIIIVSIRPLTVSYYTARISKGAASEQLAAIRKLANLGVNIGLILEERFPNSPQSAELILAEMENRTVAPARLRFNLPYKFDNDFYYEVSNRKNIHYASMLGLGEAVELLLEINGYNLDAKDGEGWTPLHYAILSGNLRTFKSLTNRSCDINAKTKFLETPLHKAVKYGKNEMAVALINRGVNPFEKNKGGVSPFVFSITHRNDRLFDIMYKMTNPAIHLKNPIYNTMDEIIGARNDHAFDMFAEKIPLGWENWRMVIAMNDFLHAFKYFLNEKKAKPEEIIFLAAYYNAARIIEYALSLDNSIVNRTDDAGNTPLHVALKEASYDTALLLLDNGADMARKNNYGDTPLQEMCKYNVPGGLIYTDGWDIDSLNGLPAKNKLPAGLIEITNSPDNNGKVIDSRNNFQIRKDRSTEIIEKIISRSGNLNVQDGLGITPLTIAIIYGNINIVEILLKHGADPNVKTDLCETSLHWAARTGNADAVRLLCAFDAKRDIKNTNGQTPLDLAIIDNFKEIAEILSK